MTKLREFLDSDPDSDKEFRHVLEMFRLLGHRDVMESLRPLWIAATYRHNATNCSGILDTIDVVFTQLNSEFIRNDMGDIHPIGCMPRHSCAICKSKKQIERIIIRRDTLCADCNAGAETRESTFEVEYETQNC